MARVKFFINGVKQTVIGASLDKEGERGIDQLKVHLPVNTAVAMNDKVLYIQDLINVANLSAIYNFQSSIKDESGNANHGTVTALGVGEDSWDGKAGVFNLR